MQCRADLRRTPGFASPARLLQATGAKVTVGGGARQVGGAPGRKGRHYVGVLAFTCAANRCVCTGEWSGICKRLPNCRSTAIAAKQFEQVCFQLIKVFAIGEPNTHRNCAISRRMHINTLHCIRTSGLGPPGNPAALTQCNRQRFLGGSVAC